MQDINYPIGLTIFKLDEDREEYTITGSLVKEYRLVGEVDNFPGAYDFEEYIQKHIDCSGIDFDYEYCQFFAYAKTLDRAKQFVDDITAWVIKVKELVD
jgi:hypothetical protein